MALTRSTAIDIIRKRVRSDDGSDIAFSDAEISTFLDYAQRTVNMATRRVLDEAINVTILANTPITQITTLATDIIDFVSVRDGTRELKKVDFAQLSRYNNNWWAPDATATRREAWAQVGKDLLAIYPVRTVVEDFEITYVKKTLTLSAIQAFELPDEDIDIALLLAEVITLQRGKNINRARTKLEELKQALEYQISTMGRQE